MGDKMEQEALPETTSVDAVIGAYVTLRSKKERINADAKAAVKKLDDQMAKLEAWLQTKMNADGSNSISTDLGTAYKSTTEKASVADMDSFLEYVRENDAWHLLEKRVSTVGVRAMLDEKLPLPAGVNWYTGTAIHVRKPSER